MATLHRGLAGSTGELSGFSAMDPLTIGDVVFYDEETPEELSFELSQVWAIHTNIGGSRTAQAMGPSAADITWRGKLWAGNVLARFQQLKAMEVAAQKVPLSFIDQAYNVVIRNVKPIYKQRWEGEYEITVTVIDDLSGQYTQNPPKGIDQQVNSISQAAQNALIQLKAQDATAYAAVQSQFAILFIAIETAGFLASLTSGETQALITTAAAAYEATIAYLNGIGTGLQGPFGGAPILGLPQPSATQNGNSASFLLMTQLASLSSLIIKNISQGQAPTVIIQQGGTGDLFDVATRYYGDPSFAFDLAAANGLITPLLSSEVAYQIVLPELSSVFS